MNEKFSGINKNLEYIRHCVNFSSACPDLICLMKVSADQYRLLFIVGTIKYTFFSIMKTVLGGTSVVRDDNRLVPRAPYPYLVFSVSFPLDQRSGTSEPGNIRIGVW